MKHKAKFEISLQEYERINRLLDIPSLSEMSDEQLLNAGANTYQHEGIMYVVFDDGSSLTFDLCSGQESYYDDVIWTSPDRSREITLECMFAFDDFEFKIDEEEYTVEIVTKH